ncbi:MAG: DNA double-strand break repair nuclease NurA [Candidatus Korarchaeum sp.]|nr:DNA double-strand break repair nuclease NurA [Candidatus Korarchaeum sp.]MDW8036172.1 DNA double-strand break repair nuclease NurA [Candidatus Korarchaeum sp.]
MEEEIEWMSLPHALQTVFFERVEEEASSLIGVIERLDECLSSIRNFLSRFFEGYDERDSSLRIGAVDGSRSPELSERLGVRYGVLTAGAVILEGGRRVGERYYAGQFKRRQALSKEASGYLLELLSEYSERKLALEVLNEVDFLFIDGSFYGFVYPVLRMKKRKVFGEKEEELFEEVCGITERLIKSGKVAGVVKRSHTRAIGGYIVAKSTPEFKEVRELSTVIDKLILSALMPPKSIFRYESLLGDENVIVYTEAARTFDKYGESQDLIEVARKKAYEPFERLKLDLEGFRRMRRVQVKAHSGVPVCEIEHPSIFEKLLDVMTSRDMFSEATGLPLAIDMIDSLVNIGAKFTEEYVSEVEARLLEKLSGRNPELVKWFFQLLNPQKAF